MSVQLNEQEYCKVTAHVELDTKLVQQKINESVKKLQKQKCKIPGFRPGKAPDHVVKLKLKNQIEKLATLDLVNEARDEVEYETHLKYFGQPEFMAGQLHDATFWCDLLFYKIPDFELKQYKDFEIPKPNLPKAEFLAEEQLEELRWLHGEEKEFTDNDVVEGTDQLGIMLKLNDMENYLSFDVDMQEERFASGFNQELLGMKLCESKTFELLGDTLTQADFQKDNFGNELNLFGQKIKFEVHLTNGCKITPCPLDDSLAQKEHYQTLNELQAALIQKYNKQIQIQNFQLLADQIIKRLIESHNIKLPDWLISAMVSKVLSGLGKNWNELDEQNKQAVMMRATNEAKLDLIFRAIREVEPETYFSDQEVVNFIKNKKMQELMLMKRTEVNGKKIILKSRSTGASTINTFSSQEELMKLTESYLKDLQKSGSLSSAVQSLKNDTLIQWLIDHSKIIE